MKARFTLLLGMLLASSAPAQVPDKRNEACLGVGGFLELGAGFNGFPKAGVSGRF
jgi:hypothetical protein